MPVNISPRSHRVKIAHGDCHVVLELRQFTAEEFSAYMRERYLNLPDDHSNEEQYHLATIHFVDRLLMNISAVDPEGKPDIVTYYDVHANEDRELNPEVEHWKEFINPLWKISAGFELTRIQSEMENSYLKN